MSQKRTVNMFAGGGSGMNQRSQSFFSNPQSSNHQNNVFVGGGNGVNQQRSQGFISNPASSNHQNNMFVGNQMGHPNQSMYGMQGRPQNIFRSQIPVVQEEEEEEEGEGEEEIEYNLFDIETRRPMNILLWGFPKAGKDSLVNSFFSKKEEIDPPCSVGDTTTKYKCYRIGRHRIFSGYGYNPGIFPKTFGWKTNEVQKVDRLVFQQNEEKALRDFQQMLAGGYRIDRERDDKTPFEPDGRGDSRNQINVVIFVIDANMKELKYTKYLSPFVNYVREEAKSRKILKYIAVTKIDKYFNRMKVEQFKKGNVLVQRDHRFVLRVVHNHGSYTNDVRAKILESLNVGDIPVFPVIGVDRSTYVVHPVIYSLMTTIVRRMSEDFKRAFNDQGEMPKFELDLFKNEDVIRIPYFYHRFKQELDMDRFRPFPFTSVKDEDSWKYILVDKHTQVLELEKLKARLFICSSCLFPNSRIMGLFLFFKDQVVKKTKPVYFETIIADENLVEVVKSACSVNPVQSTNFEFLGGDGGESSKQFLFARTKCVRLSFNGYHYVLKRCSFLPQHQAILENIYVEKKCLEQKVEILELEQKLKNNKKDFQEFKMESCKQFTQILKNQSRLEQFIRSNPILFQHQHQQRQGGNKDNKKKIQVVSDDNNNDQ